MTLWRLAAATICALAIVAPRAALMAVQPAERLLPATTKGFVSTQDVDEVRKKFNETQFGALSHDPAMQPFIDDLKQQIRAKLEKAGKKIGLTWKDVEGMYGG